MHPDWLVPDWRDSAAAGVMTTRRGGRSAGAFESMNLREGLGDDDAAVRHNLALLERSMGVPPVWLEQVHGARVVRLDARDAAPGAPVHRADASVTTAHGVACAVQVADCLPVLFAAPGAVGAAHAGWRGLAAGVLEATVQALCEAAGCAPRDVRAWLGACIGPGRFEVGPDVLEAFGVAAGGASPHFRPRAAAGKWLADLPALARERLQRAGVTQASGGGWCTVEDASRFFSFRRDRVTGRMAAAVWRRG